MIKNIHILFLMLMWKSVLSQDIPTLDGLFVLKWTVRGLENSSNPLVHQGLVFETFGLEYALNAETGDKLYFSNLNDQQIIRSLCSDSLILFSGRNGVAVVNIYSGNIIFQSSKRIARPWIREPRVVTGTRIYTALSDTIFAALDIANGKILWRKRVNEVYNVPVTENGILYFGDKKYLYAIDEETGKENWREELGAFASDPYIKDGILYVYLLNQGLVAWDIKERKIDWLLRIRDRTFRNYELRIEGDAIYFSDINLYCVSMSGEYIWINDKVKSAMSFIVGLTENHILLYKAIDDYSTLVACDKLNGNLAYESFISGSRSDNSNLPLSSLEGVNFRFGKYLFKNFFYGVDAKGDIYCFELTE